MIDLEPATRRMAHLVAAVRDDQLGDPTPCATYTVGDLLDHIGGLTVAFTRAAAKDLGDATDTPAEGDASRLGDDWRQRIPEDLAALARAWADPRAWTGTTRAGGVELPGEAGGAVALEEVVIHGWDLARAMGQPFTADEDDLAVVLGFFASFGDEARGTGFAPAAPAPADATLLDRAVAEAGRDPGWQSG